MHKEKVIKTTLLKLDLDEEVLNILAKIYDLELQDKERICRVRLEKTDPNSLNIGIKLQHPFKNLDECRSYLQKHSLPNEIISEHKDFIGKNVYMISPKLSSFEILFYNADY